MTGACTRVQVPAGRIVPWFPNSSLLGLTKHLIHMFLQGALRHRTDDGIDHLAALKEEQGWDTGDAIALGHRRVVIHVQLPDLQFASILRGHFLN
jgi:hypothetical protein